MHSAPQSARLSIAQILAPRMMSPLPQAASAVRQVQAVTIEQIIAPAGPTALVADSVIRVDAVTIVDAEVTPVEA